MLGARLPDVSYADVASAQDDPPELEAGSPPLRRLLVAVDAFALVLGWLAACVALSTVAPQPVPTTGLLVQGAALVPLGILLLSASGLYRRAVCANRAAEVARILRATLALNLVTLALLVGYGFEAAATAALVGAAVWGSVLLVERGLFREWIQLRRAGGDFGAPIVVVGGVGDSIQRTTRFLADNPFLGFDVRGVADPVSARDEALRVGASGVVLDAGSLSGDQMNTAVRDLSAAGLHVHVNSGLRGIDSRRITVSPLADETFLHVAPLSLSRRQVILKRALDVSIGSVLLVLAAPVLVVAAIAIKLDDGGPLLFRQQRVGNAGELFNLYKLRTMVVDADARLAELRERNHRDGPLFKLAADPRVTRVGRFLRASSIDELPQLFNVLEGTMSLVGPRPALEAEAAQFDHQLNQRLTVKPGVTGLWQVEARDLPSFDLYRRYDLLYVQNWSILGDVAIILRTATVVLMRGFRAVLPARFRRDDAVPE